MNNETTEILQKQLLNYTNEKNRMGEFLRYLQGGELTNPTINKKIVRAFTENLCAQIKTRMGNAQSMIDFTKERLEAQ
jgi:hypothetical protein